MTKVGGKRGDEASWLPAQSPEELKQAVYDNLRNLRLEALDVVNLRLWGNVIEPKEESIAERWSALAKLREQGLIRHLGLSNATSAQVDEAREIAPVVCVQNLYNVANRKDDALVDRLAADGIAYVPFFPIVGYSPVQSARLSEVANQLSATPMQVALAWLLRRSNNILLIPGTSSLEHLRENLAAAELELPEDAVKSLDGI